MVLRFLAPLFMALAMGMSAMPAAAQRLEDLPIDRQLDLIASSINQRLPTLVSDTVRFDSIQAGPGLVLAMNYTLLMPREEAAPQIERMNREMLQRGVTTFCPSNAMRALLHQGVEVVLRMVDPQGQEVLGLRVTRQQCE